jgi:hypothetical protein
MKFDIGDFYENAKLQSCLQSNKKYQALHSKTSIRLIVDGDINSPQTQFCSTLGATLYFYTVDSTSGSPIPNTPQLCVTVVYIADLTGRLIKLQEQPQRSAMF